MPRSVTWTKAMPEGLNWESIEPAPPINGKHTYNWIAPDALIREYQEAGFRNIHIYTEARSPWACSKPKPLIGSESQLPKSEYLKDYAAVRRDTIIVGVSNRIEIWSKDNWQKFYGNSQPTFEEIAEKLLDI